jgi:prefoldin alpha subunit
MISRVSDIERVHGIGSDIMVPLTSSLYVPGKLVEEKTVIVDIGTGYYVSKVTFIFIMT